jgi:predicted ATPase
MPSPLEAVPILPQFLADAPDQEEHLPLFVAREQELADLKAALDTAHQGIGQPLFVIGGAGRGKTMLVQEFARRAQADDPTLLVVSGNCNAHTGLGDPYSPFRELLTTLSGEVEARWRSGLISHERARRLWQAMPITISALVEHAPDLVDNFVPAQALQARATAVGLADTAWYEQLANLSANHHQPIKQERICTQYTAVLKAVAARHPLVLIVEDLHWVDPSSSSLLFHLSRHIGDSPILLLGTYRPAEVAVNQGAERHPLADIVGELKRQHGDIWLDLAEVTDGRHFVDALLNSQPNRLDEAFRQALFTHTAGHPLFTVEILRDMQDRGDLVRDEAGVWHETATIDWQTLPPKVEGVIEQRINRLEKELQTVLTIASVEGESFTAEVIARVQSLDERQLVQRLSRELDKQHRLVAAEALERLGQQRLSLYRFRHQLFQHYLYNNLADTERAYLHEDVGTVLEALYGEETARIAVQLAHHFERAGVTDKAVTYLQHAGRQAARNSANQEAVDFYNSALKLLKTLPDSIERDRQELALLVALGNTLIATKGYTSPDVEQTYSRARALCRQIGETPQLFPVLYGLSAFYLVQAKYQAALELAEQMLCTAQGQPNSGPLLRGYVSLGSALVMSAVLVMKGHFASGRERLEQNVKLYDIRRHGDSAFHYGQDLGVMGLCNLSLTLWMQGYPGQARQRSQDAIGLARELAHPFTLGYALIYSQICHLACRDWQMAQKHADETITLSTQQDFPLGMIMAILLKGKTLAEQRQLATGIAEMRREIQTCEVIGLGLFRSMTLIFLAAALGEAGEIDEALALVAKGMAFVAESGEKLWEAELYRLRGELLHKQGADAGEVAQQFQQAIDIARSQQAKSLELRAVMSLCRLWRDQGQTEAARERLAEIYDWFSEGFDTGDLIEARTLLDELEK